MTGAAIGAIPQGGNAALKGDRIVVRIDWRAPAGVDADTSAYLLNENGKVRDDSDMIFYNQPQGAGGAIRYAAGADAKAVFEVDLARLPREITRIVFCVTIDEALARRQTLALLSDARISVGSREATPDVVYTPVLAGASEAAMTFGELYLRNGLWKFRAIGQGYNGGLAPLARSFGIDVAEARAPVAPAPVPTPVNLSKISLDKPGQSISLAKRGTSFGEIVINLNWSRGKTGSSGGKAIDLDLGCLFELADGTKNVVQALGRSFGTFDAAPYIALSGDDRTGDVATGETMRINGAHWSKLRRVAIFALIYDGVPNWRQTDAVVTVTTAGQPPIEVRMTDGRDDKRLCGAVLLENVGGTLKASRIVDYFTSQSELDRALGWGLKWRTGSKD